MDHTFFPGYRKTLLSPEEILLSIEIPYSREVRGWELLQSLPKLCHYQAADKESKDSLKIIVSNYNLQSQL